MWERAGEDILPLLLSPFWLLLLLLFLLRPRELRALNFFKDFIAEGEACVSSELRSARYYDGGRSRARGGL